MFKMHHRASTNTHTLHRPSNITTHKIFLFFPLFSFSKVGNPELHTYTHLHATRKDLITPTCINTHLSTPTLIVLTYSYAHISCTPTHTLHLHTPYIPIHTYAHLHTHTHPYTHLHMPTHTHAYIHLHTSTHINTPTHALDIP